MKSSVIFHCLHGFLGRAQDWDEVLVNEFSKHREFSFENYQLFSHSEDDSLNLVSNLHQPRPEVRGLTLPCPDEEQGFTMTVECAKRVNSTAKTIARKATLAGHQIQQIILGYSLGSRIALHCLLESPDLWAAGIVVSCHPGLASSEERAQRLESDLNWARRFREESWSSLTLDWNSQAVFERGIPALERREEDFSREKLARLMEGCSLGLQRDLKPSLKDLAVPILWISGEHDAKFRSIAERMFGWNPKFGHVSLRGVGHRAPWDQPELFRDSVKRFLKEHGLFVKSEEF